MMKVKIPPYDKHYQLPSLPEGDIASALVRWQIVKADWAQHIVAIICPGLYRFFGEDARIVATTYGLDLKEIERVTYCEMPFSKKAESITFAELLKSYRMKVSEITYGGNAMIRCDEDIT